MDCPICLTLIDLNSKNFVSTECGHQFHCRCLMTHVSHNGYSCPFCRQNMLKGTNTSIEETNTSIDETNTSIDDFIPFQMENSVYEWLRDVATTSIGRGRGGRILPDNTVLWYVDRTPTNPPISDC